MVQIFHRGAGATAAVRLPLQNSQESLMILAQRYNINPKTVAKWRGRDMVEDGRAGPKNTRSTVLNIEEDAIIVVSKPFPAAA